MSGSSYDEVRRDLWAEICHISGHVGPINDHIELYKDLSIAGDDEWELLEILRDRYSVDLSDFGSDAYFPIETDAIWYRLARIFGYSGRKWHSFTLAHLVSAVRNGEWLKS